MTFANKLRQPISIDERADVHRVTIVTPLSRSPSHIAVLTVTPPNGTPRGITALRLMSFVRNYRRTPSIVGPMQLISFIHQHSRTWRQL